MSPAVTVLRIIMCEWRGVATKKERKRRKSYRAIEIEMLNYALQIDLGCYVNVCQIQTLNIIQITLKCH